MKTKKIVLTGGPCAGKTTALTELEKEFTEKGYQVLMVPEAATILINSGIRPFGPHKLKTVDFQSQVIKLQLIPTSTSNSLFHGNLYSAFKFVCKNSPTLFSYGFISSASLPVSGCSSICLTFA